MADQQPTDKVQESPVTEEVFLEKIDHPALNKFVKQTISYKDGYYRVQPYNMIFPKSYLKFTKRIREFKVENSDVWVATTIKAGNN